MFLCRFDSNETMALVQAVLFYKATIDLSTSPRFFIDLKL